MKSLACALVVVASLAGCCVGAATLPYLVNSSQISVSGISSGAFMAGQILVAYSSIFMGAGVVAGGPYYCAKGSMTTAEIDCMYLPSGIVLSTLWTATSDFASKNQIDAVSNMADQKLYLFSGTKDTVVDSGVVEKADEYWGKYLPDSNIMFENSIAAEHAWITDDYGSACSHLGTPYINNCDYDGAGIMYNFIYGTLNPAGTMVSANMISFDQADYVESGTPKSISMGTTGYMYVPTACKAGTTACKLTFVFHGCSQTIDDIGNKFYMNSGVNEWAETNNIIVVYPQAIKSMSSPSNPEGCFDWWGYTDSLTSDLYATNKGAQMMFVRNILKAFGI